MYGVLRAVLSCIRNTYNIQVITCATTLQHTAPLANTTRGMPRLMGGLFVWKMSDHDPCRGLSSSCHETGLSHSERHFLCARRAFNKTSFPTSRSSAPALSSSHQTLGPEISLPSRLSRVCLCAAVCNHVLCFPEDPPTFSPSETRFLRPAERSAIKTWSARVARIELFR
jgi:hypothetical protein